MACGMVRHESKNLSFFIVCPRVYIFSSLTANHSISTVTSVYGLKSVGWWSVFVGQKLTCFVRLMSKACEKNI